jgi:biotin carboxyl carrier protein
MIPIPPCTVVTSPVDGRVGRLVDDGAEVGAGDVVAVVESVRGSAQLRAPAPGRIGGALAGSAQPISVGEGVVWLARA